MKCQFGLLHTNERPATREERALLLAELPERPAETSGEIVEDSLLMGFRGDRITCEEDFEIQPLDNGPYILTWDGRLDNRQDLALRLGLTHLETIPDPSIVLHAYEAYGRDGLRDLIGEFALTLWCRRTRTLLVARSECGARPLYYAFADGTLFWSSDFGHLVRVSGVSLEVSEAYFLEFVLSQPNTKLTPLTHVNAVPAGCILEFRCGALKHTDTLWDPNRVGMLPYSTDGQYEEHLRDAITTAVRARMRAKKPIFAELSGGLDSSSIVLTADKVLRDAGKPREILRTISGVYEDSLSCDEYKFIRLVEEQRGCPTLLVGEREQRFTLGLQEPEFTGLPNPNHLTPGRYQTFESLVRASGGRVLLTGLGGDHLFWSAPEGAPLVADELQRANLLGALREAQIWAKAARVPILYILFNRSIPLAMGKPFNLLEIPTWLGRKMRLAFSTHKAELLGDQTIDADPSKRAQRFAVDLLFRTIGCGYFNEYRDLFVSHPYTHRPLVEFCLSTPLSQFLRAGQTRSLMRRALKDLLPKKICNRTTKAGADEAYLRALQREWTNQPDVLRWKVCESGFVDPTSLFRAFEAMRLGIHNQGGYLMRLLSLELWLRSLGRVRTGNKSFKQRVG